MAGDQEFSGAPLTLSDTATVWRQLSRARLREFLQFDSTAAGILSAVTALLGAAFAIIGRNRRALELVTTAHRSTRFRPVRAVVKRILQQPQAPGSAISIWSATPKNLACRWISSRVKLPSHGQHYPYINPRTGQFADESTLPDVLLQMSERYADYDPRAWVMENMTPQIATERLNQTIRRVALARGEPWSSDIVVRTVQLKRAPYWNPTDAVRFSGDYDYLRSVLR